MIDSDAVRLKIVKKRLNWLKNDPRATCFYLFKLLMLLENERKSQVKKNNTPVDRINSSHLLTSTTSINLSLTKENEITLGVKTGNFNFEKYTSDNHLVEALSEPMPGYQVTPAEAFTDLKEPSENIPLVEPVFISESGPRFENFSAEVNGKLNLYDMVLSILMRPEKDTTKEIIARINAEWVDVYEKKPEPFAWVDMNNEKQCLWVMQYMKKNHLGIPLKAVNNNQRWHYIVATFDVWCGWSDNDIVRLASNSKKTKKNKSTLFSDLEKSPEQRKVEFLARMEKAWQQKEFRKHNKNENALIKITQSSMKKLNALSEFYSIPPGKILKQLIDQALIDMSKKSDFS